MKEIEQSAVSASSSVITLFHIFQINTPASDSLVSQLPGPVSFHNIPSSPNPPCGSGFVSHMTYFNHFLPGTQINVFPHCYISHLSKRYNIPYQPLALKHLILLQCLRDKRSNS